ncbi:MAG: class II D-tagatose-bisphosphate aldolase, non-catalytic subunit [Candidatus Bathyarchaeota archaeon]|nr:class II D-tagatose-bisphosphate aldolase, non-catalytic subunit [Candidatus Bathyarchaeota archaeon]
MEHEFDKSFIRKVSMERGTPIVDLMLNTCNRIGKGSPENITLLAACPNSVSVVKSALRSAKKFSAPIMFAATLNQVDLDGGYTTWTQERFVSILKEETEKIGFKGPTIVALDHGGPWLKDRHAMENWGFDETMRWVKRSLVASLEAGYDLLHIDPTVDKTLPEGENIRIETVAERTLELIEYVENVRRDRGLPKISYEVGTEEVHGGLANLHRFRRFLKLLKVGLAEMGMGDVWPCFVVGKVGTDLHTTLFDSITARTLVDIAEEHGSYIKGHYTDYVSNPEDYPKSGMGGANVGPEFSQAEFDTLGHLTKIEGNLARAGGVAEPSGLRRVLKKQIVKSQRWKKWLLKSERGKPFSDLSTERKMWLLRTGSRYIWTRNPVIEARARLYLNLHENGIDAEERVLQAIDRVMAKYFASFNLVDATPRIKGKLK